MQSYDFRLLRMSPRILPVIFLIIGLVARLEVGILTSRQTGIASFVIAETVTKTEAKIQVVSKNVTQTVSIVRNQTVSQVDLIRVLGPLGCEVGDEVAYKVISLSGQPIEGALVKVNNISRVTDIDGVVRFIFKEPGFYKITALSMGQEASNYTVVYPKGNESMPIRGLRFTPFHKISFHFMRLAGANFIYFKVWYALDDEANIKPALHTGSYVTPCTQDELENQARKIISLARNYGFKIFLVPFLWRSDVKLDAPLEEKTKIFVVRPEYKSKFFEQLSKVVSQIASFAEENGVEMFTPVCELHRYIGYEESSTWHQMVLPKLREKYSGKLVICDQDYMSDYFAKNIEAGLIPMFNYSGYDYIGLIINPSGTRSWEELERVVNETLKYANDLRKKFRVGVIISNVGTLGSAEWMLDETPSDWSKARAKFFEVVLRLSTGKVDGVFFDCWHYENRVESIVGRMFIQSKEPYNVIKRYLATPYNEEENLTSGWSKFIKDKEYVLWQLILPSSVAKPTFLEVEGVFNDLQGDCENKTLDLKSVRVSRDQNNILISIDFYVEKPSCEVVLHLDVNSDGIGDYHIRTYHLGRASLFKSLRPDIHTFLSTLNSTCDHEVIVKIPLEIVGYPEKLGLQVASWDRRTNQASDDFGDFNWMNWLVFKLPSYRQSLHPEKVLTDKCLTLSRQCSLKIE